MGVLDRATGELVQEPISLGGAFAWLFTSPIGRRLRPALFHSTLLHRLIERYADSPLSRRHIAGFVAANRIDLGEAIVPEGGFACFNDLFTRKLKPGARPVDPDPSALVSPADAKLFVVPELQEGERIDIKGIAFTASELLGDSAAGRSFAGGAAAVFRLYLPDCHRVYFPCDGVAASPRLIAGHYDPVTPYPGNDARFYATNRRVVTMLESNRFGLLALVDIGGFLISSIEATFPPGSRVRKGDEKSLFRFGGSTVVVLSQRDAVRYDDDLCRHSRDGHEVKVRIGERLGASGLTS